MVSLGIEAQRITPTRLAMHARPLPQLSMILVRRHAHIAVPKHNHALLARQLDIRVLRQPRGLVATSQFNVMMVVVQRECALEQRLQPIPTYPDSRPSDIVPATPALRPGCPLEHFVLVPVNRLLSLYTAIGSEMRDAPAVDEDVVVGLEAEADALGADIEGDVEGRHGGYAVVGGEDIRIFGVLYAPERCAVRRRRGGEVRCGEGEDRSDGAEDVHPLWRRPSAEAVARPRV